MKKRKSGKSFLAVALVCFIALMAVCSSCSSDTSDDSAEATEEEHEMITAKDKVELNPARLSTTSGLSQASFDYCDIGDAAWMYVGADYGLINLYCIYTPAPDKPWGTEALEFTRDELSSGKKIYVEYEEGAETDIYGEKQAWVWVGGSLLQEELLENGLAKMSALSGNAKYSENLIAAEDYAEQNEIGVWGKW